MDTNSQACSQISDFVPIARILGEELIEDVENLSSILLDQKLENKRLIIINIVCKTPTGGGLVKQIMHKYLNYSQNLSVESNFPNDVDLDLDFDKQICMSKAYTLDIGTEVIAVILMITPFIKLKNVFVKALQFSGILASEQIICDDDAFSEEEEYLKLCLEVGEISGLERNSLLITSDKISTLSSDGFNAGIEAINHIISEISSEEERNKIRRAFAHSACYVKYKHDYQREHLKYFLLRCFSPEILVVKKYCGIDLSGKSLLLHFQGARKAPKKPPVKPPVKAPKQPPVKAPESWQRKVWNFISKAAPPCCTVSQIVILVILAIVCQANTENCFNYQ